MELSELSENLEFSELSQNGLWKFAQAQSGSGLWKLVQEQSSVACESSYKHKQFKTFDFKLSDYSELNYFLKMLAFSIFCLDLSTLYAYNNSRVKNVNKKGGATMKEKVKIIADMIMKIIVTEEVQNFKSHLDDYLFQFYEKRVDEVEQTIILEMGQVLVEFIDLMQEYSDFLQEY